MSIKTVKFSNRLYPSIEKTDCIVLRRYDNDSPYIDVALPFHEDMPNIVLTIPEAMDLKNAIDQLLNIKFIEMGEK